VGALLDPSGGGLLHVLPWLLNPPCLRVAEQRGFTSYTRTEQGAPETFAAGPPRRRLRFCVRMLCFILYETNAAEVYDAEMELGEKVRYGRP
jgi:hypothetical protein